MIGFIPIPQAALPHSQVMCDETWNTGAEAMREAAALYMDVEEQSGYADAIRDIPIPARPK
jgi:hypothetical protein